MESGRCWGASIVSLPDFSIHIHSPTVLVGTLSSYEQILAKRTVLGSRRERGLRRQGLRLFDYDIESEGELLIAIAAPPDNRLTTNFSLSTSRYRMSRHTL